MLRILTFLLIASTPLLASPKCVELGWTGGSVGTETKWVKGKMFTKANKIRIIYDWRSGIIKGKLKAGTIKGKWKQTNSWGKLFFGRVMPDGKRMGWWSRKRNKTQFPFIMRRCETEAP